MKLSDQEIARQQQSFEAYKAQRGSIFDSRAISIANSEHQMRERLHAEANAPSQRDALLTSLTNQRSSWLKMGRPVEMLDGQIAKIYGDIVTEKKHAKTLGSAEYKETEVFVRALKALTAGDVAAHHQLQLAHESYLAHEDNERYKADIRHLWDQSYAAEQQRRLDANIAVDKSNMESAVASRDEAKRQLDFDVLAQDAKGVTNE